MRTMTRTKILNELDRSARILDPELPREYLPPNDAYEALRKDLLSSKKWGRNFRRDYSRIALKRAREAQQAGALDLALSWWTQSFHSFLLIKKETDTFAKCPGCFRIGINPPGGEFRCHVHRGNPYVSLRTSEGTDKLLAAWRAAAGAVPDLFCYPHGPLAIWQVSGAHPRPRFPQPPIATRRWWRWPSPSIPADVKIPWNLCPRVLAWLRNSGLDPQFTPPSEWLPVLLQDGEPANRQVTEFIKALSPNLGYYIALVFAAEASSEFKLRAAQQQASAHRSAGQAACALKTSRSTARRWMRKAKAAGR